MPVWAQILLPLIAFVYITWLVVDRVKRSYARQRNLEYFDEWMRRSRDA